jgi:hypothetical protein
MNTRRGGSLWIIGRVGILIVFVVMPMMRICQKVKYDPVNEAHRKCMKAYDECNKYPVLSDGWNTNKAAGDFWCGEAQRLRKEIRGTKP